ncbi:LysR family transcriptional regulator [Endozoicomonadaceae bacterium StTr2]
MTGSGLEELRIFVTVVREQGFAAAGRYLNLPPSTVSRKVTQLEEQLNCRLLERSTRRLRLTDIGRTYFRQCATALDTIDDASREILQRSSEPRGLLRLSCPISLSGWVASCVARFMEQWADVRVDIEFTNEFPSLLEQAIDVAIVEGELPASDLIALPLGKLQYQLFASRQYLADFGTPQHPDELSRHRLITCWPLRDWYLQDGNEQILFHPRPQLNVNEFAAAYRAAREGLGIVNLPQSYVAMQEGESSLTGVLPRWHGEQRNISLIYRSRELLPRRARLFIDSIREQMAPVLVSS